MEIGRSAMQSTFNQAQGSVRFEDAQSSPRLVVGEHWERVQLISEFTVKSVSEEPAGSGSGGIEKANELKTEKLCEIQDHCWLMIMG